MIPNVWSWTPGKIASVEARNGNPVTGVPESAYRATTRCKSAAPNPAVRSPSAVAMRNGRAL